MSTSTALDRLAMRGRPEGSPVMHQNWENLLFLHWPVDPAVMRPLIPPALEIDTFEGQAYIGITPFSLTGLRLLSLPAVPGLESFLEINVRTYVHYRGMPGIWFFSLDASKLIPAMAARVLFALPYFKASMEFNRDGNEFQFTSKRTVPPDAHFRVRWTTGMRLREPALESLAFFLVERYCFFANVGDQMTMTRVYHHPWILDEGFVLEQESTMISSLGLPEPTGPALTHFSQSLNVEVWPPVDT
jgi:uncharacterized protein YqjF (DUF2071 family)